MNKKTGFLLSALMGSLVLSATVSEAYAARMGGGRSFGGRPSFNMPYQRSPSPANPGMNRPGAPAQQPAMSAAQQRNQAMRNNLSQRGGFGRLLGGLALGGLLGALFMGGGFEGINFLDILIFGGVAFLLFKFFAARRQSAERTATSGAGYYGEAAAASDSVYGRQTHDASDHPGRAGFDTDILSRKGGFSGGTTTGGSVPVPTDFDAPAFLSGAKAAYETMQKAWDEGDVAELRGLTTDKVFAELQEQILARGGAENVTDLLKVDVELLEVRDIGSDREVTVLFDVLMREERDARPSQVREVWHFTRSRNSRQPTWFLDGIQQLEE
jgi:predicted lipid-binding transport protein (Tim44 family)